MREGFIAVGRCSKLFGGVGEIYANLYTTFPSEFSIEEPLFVKIDELMVPLFLSSFARRGQKGVVVLFDDIDTQGRAEELLGLELYLPEDDVDDDYEDFDFVGYSVIVNNEIVGQIEEYIDNPMNPLFSIDVDGREVLIPANESMIAGIDPDEQIIEFELPEGLWELYMEEE